MAMERFLGIIPARYGSSRFPGKPLADIKGKTMIQHVYERALGSAYLSDLVVATDDQRIMDVVEEFGGKAVMTSETHKSGTDRCREVLEKLEEKGNQYSVVINIQGDEPYIDPRQIDEVAEMFTKVGIQIATLARKIDKEDDLFNTNVNKVVFGRDEKAIYFSRHPIPFQQNVDRKVWLSNYTYYKHIGIYAYRSQTLQKITQLERSKLEIAESLEQLRWIENGYKIRVLLTDYESNAVDTPEDLSKFLNIS